ncbi:DUF3842 domain-containing protein, partial [Dysosmobacter welbionis]
SSPWQASASPMNTRPAPPCSCWCLWAWLPAWAAACCGTCWPGTRPTFSSSMSMPPPPWPGRWPAWSFGPWRERWPPCSAAVRLWSPSASSPPTSAGTCLTPMTEQTASPDRERSFPVRGTLLQAVNVRARIRRFSHAAQWRCQVLF